MSRRRFFAPPDAFAGQSVTLTSDEAKHLRDVLRLKHEDEVYVFDGEGKEFRCTIAQMNRNEVTLENCEEMDPAHPESPLQFTLAVALLKGEKFDLVVQKATELGVSRIVPVATQYADIHLRDASDADKRVSRWRRIALEAAKQCGRAKVPEVRMPVTFDSLMTTSDESVRLMFSERKGKTLSDSLLVSPPPTSVSALVGSEGGWSDEEISQASAAGWKVVTLRGRVLRAETAAIAVSVLLQHVYGDLK
ncbi:MAG TPA: 16S rRNA (uracil(1498)-N(3))-methyltransferase [Pyrinomonadaceae bacterium]|jgi:16S rRNA (uracil1498-N3)-methyltransferase|nr:16S rRNA (uracil(1498)-N(3))-methyltransferase [Pyrinomonadaceae bacterium]